MVQDVSTPEIQAIMDDFARDTGLSSEKAPRRYLWTDAFAVCNFLDLYRRTGEERYLDLARRLVSQVHHGLGRHRADDPRSGWISGLDEEEGEEHPTRNGLRIGKELNERRPGERYDPKLEWDRDGQYYHYLTKWMHALNRAGRVTADPTYPFWAAELARAAHAGFTYLPAGGRPVRMCWKMSIDLSYPLVPSMGQHDPLDGLITYNEIQATVPRGAERATWPDLQAEIADAARMCEGRDWTTGDALGVGGLLADAYRVAQLVSAGAAMGADLLQILLDAAQVSLRAYRRKGGLHLPLAYRLAFRELGLSIGLRAVVRMQALVEERPAAFAGQPALHTQIDALSQHVPLTAEIEKFWADQAGRETGSWTAHRDINMVMLATSLAPEGFLTI
jgi:hypothetical protein